MADNRRDFLKKGALLGLGTIAGALKSEVFVTSPQTNDLNFINTPFNLPALPYAYDALEPFIDRQTMEIHHSKHHKSYVDKLNSADLSSLNMKLSDTDKCKSISNSSPALIRNNLGGHYNHSLFWELLLPNPKNIPNAAGGKLSEAITSTFKSFDDFKKEFSEKALKHFGSGWCWLIKNDSGKLQIVSTNNQDNPLMKLSEVNGRPVIALDVWEHAYYLKYQNKRADYIANWWSIINWQKAEELFNAI